MMLRLPSKTLKIMQRLVNGLDMEPCLSKKI